MHETLQISLLGWLPGTSWWHTKKGKINYFYVSVTLKFVSDQRAMWPTFENHSLLLVAWLVKLYSSLFCCPKIVTLCFSCSKLNKTEPLCNSQWYWEEPPKNVSGHFIDSIANDLCPLTVNIWSLARDYLLGSTPIERLNLIGQLMIKYAQLPSRWD